MNPYRKNYQNQVKTIKIAQFSDLALVILCINLIGWISKTFVETQGYRVWDI